MNYYELYEIATELLGAGWTAEEREDILNQHRDDLDLTDDEWERVFGMMEETATYEVLPEYYDDFGATEDNNICTMKDLRHFARSWDKPLDEIMTMVVLVELIQR